MKDLLIGFSEKSIVPSKKAPLVGQFFERIADHVETDISITAMAIQSGNESAIIISCDLLSVAQTLLAKAREKFTLLNTEVSPNKLVIGATHTHTSLSYYGAEALGTEILNEFLPKDKQYTALVQHDDTVLNEFEALEFLADKIAQAAHEAWDNREKALIANEFGRAVVGFCRRVSYDDGSGLMWGDTNTANFVAMEGGNDSGIELLYIFNKAKSLKGIVANIACPSQILEHRSFISADYWGEVKVRLRKEFGEQLFLLPMCGAGGDQCPRDLIRWVNPETPIDDPNIKRPNYIERKADPSMFDLSGCKLVAKRIANEIISVFEEITEIKENVPFEYRNMILDLPIRKATIADYNNAVREIEYYVTKNCDKAVFNFEDNAKMHIYAGTIERFRQQQIQELVPTEVHIFRLGDIAFASNPFELFLDYGNYIKARSKAKQTFIMQLTGGSLGYLPTAKAEKAGHYSAYISSGNVGHEGGDLLVRKTVSEINDMWG